MLSVHQESSFKIMIISLGKSRGDYKGGRSRGKELNKGAELLIEMDSTAVLIWK